MKKSYSKPEIMFERFTMSTNIAAGCEEKFGLYSRGSCGIPGNFPNTTIFNTSAADTDCFYDGEESDKYNDLCYHVPDGSNNLFNS